MGLHGPQVTETTLGRSIHAQSSCGGDFMSLSFESIGVAGSCGAG